MTSADSFHAKIYDFACSCWIVIGVLDLLSSVLIIASMFIVPMTQYEQETIVSTWVEVAISIPMCLLAIVMGFAARHHKRWGVTGLEILSWLGAAGCIGALCFTIHYLLQHLHSDYPYRVAGVMGTALSLAGVALMIAFIYLFKHERKLLANPPE